MKNADMPAAPITITHGHGNYAEAEHYLGLTKREAFEMAAMQGLLSNHAIIDNHDKEGVEWIVKHARSQADAMLKEHDK